MSLKHVLDHRNAWISSLPLTQSDWFQFSVFIQSVFYSNSLFGLLPFFKNFSVRHSQVSSMWGNMNPDELCVPSGFVRWFFQFLGVIAAYWPLHKAWRGCGPPCCTNPKTKPQATAGHCRQPIHAHEKGYSAPRRPCHLYILQQALLTKFRM